LIGFVFVGGSVCARLSGENEYGRCLVTEGLSRASAIFAAVSDVSLRVKRGTIHALIGPNGAGKTTCFNMLRNSSPRRAAGSRSTDATITNLKPADVARLGLVRSFQISAVFPHLTAFENIRIALQRKRGDSFDFWRSKAALGRLMNGRWRYWKTLGWAPSLIRRRVKSLMAANEP